MFEDCSHIYASGSHFSTVGRDQHNVGGDQYTAAHDQHFYQATVHIVIPTTTSDETVQHALDSVYHVSHQDSPSSAAEIMSFHKCSVYNMASSTLYDIMHWLDRIKDYSDYLYLKEPLLEPLHRILWLTGIAIQVFEDTPLGPNLAASINPEVERCHTTLRFMLDRINRYRLTLASTPNRNLWPLVLWSSCEVHVLAWKLRAHQRSLGQFLVALNSQVILCAIRCRSPELDVCNIQNYMGRPRTQTTCGLYISQRISGICQSGSSFPS